MTSPCHVRRHLLDDLRKTPLFVRESTPPYVCSGPLVPCLFGVTKEQVEAKYPHGARLYQYGRVVPCFPDPIPDSNYLTLPALLHRLSTQECPESAEMDGHARCCDRTGRIGTVCEGHLGLVIEIPGFKVNVPQIDPAHIPPTDPVLVSGLEGQR